MKVNTKTLIGLTLAILLLFGGTFGMKYYLQLTSEKMISKIVIIEDYLTNGDLYSAENVALKLTDEWEVLEPKWTTLTNHHEIDSITTSLKNVVEFIRFNDIPNSMANLESLKHYIEHIPAMEEFTLKNIL